MKEKDLSECHRVVKSYLDKTIMLAFILTSILFAYFCLVVYTHWKNFGIEFKR